MHQIISVYAVCVSPFIDSYCVTWNTLLLFLIRQIVLSWNSSPSWHSVLRICTRLSHNCMTYICERQCILNNNVL